MARPDRQTREAVDFVIVGGGSAGCVLANRLSADPSVRVVLLEAGSANRGPIIAMPAATDFYGIGNPLYDWRYRTAPDSSRAGRSEVWPRGRGLGGSSAINGLVHMQGLPADFAAWEAEGARGWGWDDVAPAFASIHDRGDGHGGLIVSALADVHPTTERFVASAIASGLRHSTSLSDDPDPGVGLVGVTSADGRRVSNRTAFLDPVRKRPNLAVHTHALVTQLLFDGRRCSGVRYRRFGREHVLRAGHVVLAAGAIATPHLMLVSGIGPAAQLREAGIPVAADRQGVGANLQDHASVYLAYESRLPTLNAEQGWIRRLRHAWDWWRHGRGPATTPGGQALAYLRTHATLPAPDIQVQFTPIGYSLRDGHLQVPASSSVTAVVSLNRPHSRGRVSVTHTDIRVRPVIAPELLSAPHDVETLCAGVRMAAAMIGNGPLADVLGAPLPHSPALTTADADLAAALRLGAGTNFHSAGTCRIGPPGDAMAVVGPGLRVHGFDGLSVADASVMPSLVSANTNATVTMIAERAAGFLLGGHEE